MRKPKQESKQILGIAHPLNGTTVGYSSKGRSRLWIIKVASHNTGKIEKKRATHAKMVRWLIRPVNNG
jgi:hypothetical protein